MIDADGYPTTYWPSYDDIWALLVARYWWLMTQYIVAFWRYADWRNSNAIRLTNNGYCGGDMVVVNGITYPNDVKKYWPVMMADPIVQFPVFPQTADCVANDYLFNAMTWYCRAMNVLLTNQTDWWRWLRWRMKDWRSSNDKWRIGILLKDVLWKDDDGLTIPLLWLMTGWRRGLASRNSGLAHFLILLLWWRRAVIGLTWPCSLLWRSYRIVANCLLIPDIHYPYCYPAIDLRYERSLAFVCGWRIDCYWLTGYSPTWQYRTCIIVWWWWYW